MKCPHCSSEIPDASKFCTNCGQSIPDAPQQTASAQPTAQPTAQNYAQPGYSNYSGYLGYPGYQQPAQNGAYYSTVPNYNNTAVTGAQQGKTPGEIAAIVIAIVVSIVSVFAAIIIFVLYMEKISDTYDFDDFDDSISSSYFDDFDNFSGYGIDDFSDEDSLDHFLDYYNSIMGTKAQYPASSPAKEHTAIEFDDYLYSFSDGNIDTTYSVELDEAYRGEAALKLLEGMKQVSLTSEQELYLVKFKVTVTEQDTEAYVSPAPTIFTAAYNGEDEGTEGKQYDSLTYLDYKDKTQLLKKGESGTRWMAFIVDKSDERPLIMWDKYEGEYFRYSKAAVSSAAGLQAGAAMESESSVSSN